VWNNIAAHGKVAQGLGFHEKDQYQLKFDDPKYDDIESSVGKQYFA